MIAFLSSSALGLDVQVNVQVPDTKGLMLECNSGGWFPSPQMEWRDSRGKVIPHSSKSSSVDGAGLLHLKMSVLLKNSTHSPVTCCICNPVTGQRKGQVLSYQVSACGLALSRRNCFHLCDRQKIKLTEINKCEIALQTTNCSRHVIFKLY